MSVMIIAEAGVNHNGQLTIAKELVDMAKECGADAIKFQTFKTYESTGIYAPKAEYQIRNTSDNESQYEMIKKLELPFEAFDEISAYCKQKDIIFISTPDGVESLQYLVSLDIPFIKVGSTEITNYKFLEQIGKTGKEIILSTGMSYLSEVDSAIRVIKSTGNEKIKLMQCTTDYPTLAEDVNINAMITMRNAFHLPIGLSDHTLTNEAAIAAVALGAVLIEKHITLDHTMSGPDHKASMEPMAFASYVCAIKTTEKIMGDGIKRPTKREMENRTAARKSIVAAYDIACGTVLTSSMLTFKRPGNGLEPMMESYLIGRKVQRNICKDEMIQWKDI